MKACALSPALALLFLLGYAKAASAGEQQAQARFWCESLRFSQGNYAGDTLDLSTVSGTPNGELAPYDGKSLVTGFTLDFSGMGIYGTMLVGLPPLVDTDSNGFDDFYESAHSVYATTSGTYETAIGSGTVTATWNRVAGSKDGTCVLKLVDGIYGALGDFSHSFELLEYTGSIFYTPGMNTVSNRLSLAQTGSLTSLFSGVFSLTKDPANRFNRLSLPAGTLTNTILGDLSFVETVVVRETPWPTNYYGYIDFKDGDLRTSEPDYLYWTISIDDLNDANGNGIPDFSDDPVVRPPTLSISVGSSGLTIQINGENGRTHLLQESATLLSASWKTTSTFIITNSPQMVSLPRPQTNMFWRVLAQ